MFLIFKMSIRHTKTRIYYARIFWLEERQTNPNRVEFVDNRTDK